MKNALKLVLILVIVISTIFSALYIFEVYDRATLLEGFYKTLLVIGVSTLSGYVIGFLSRK